MRNRKSNASWGKPVHRRAPPIILLISLTLSTATAQEALRSSIAGQQAAEALRLRPSSMPYTVKSGDLRLLITPSMGLDWNDNVYNRENKEDDFILRPALTLNASYPITQRNLLQLNVTFGYQKYFDHDDLSTWYVQSGSALSFDIFVKDVLINLHDRFSYVQDSAREASVANTGSYGTLENTVGLAATWDLQDLTLSAGYDHQNTLSTSDEFQYRDNASELFFGRAGLRVHPELTTGLEATGSFTAYDQPYLNDNTGYSVGVYADWRPGKALSVQPRGGYAVYMFDQNSASLQTEDLNTWYLGLRVSHAITESVTYTLDAGREVRLGIQSDVIEDWYVRPSATWSIVKDLSLSTFLSYEHGQQGSGNVFGNLEETYDWFGAGFGLSRSISKRLTVALNYRLTIRTSDLPGRDYDQNVIGLLLTYRPG